MVSCSVLFEKSAEPLTSESPKAPAFFGDLNLDQVVNAITAGKEEYNLEPFFYTPLSSLEAIEYRHEIMRDLENEVIFGHIKSFECNMRAMREQLTQAEKLHYGSQKKRWFLEAVEMYCQAITGLAMDLSCADIRSRGLSLFRDYLRSYVDSDRFIALLSETKKLLFDLSTVKYSICIDRRSVKVSRYDNEPDYSAEVEQAFEKFKQDGVKDYTVEFLELPSMNHVEAKILDLVSELYPDLFSRLDDFCTKNIRYADETVIAFDREIQFYVAYLEHIGLLKRAGLKFCYPQISNMCKEVCNYEGFDMALAFKLVNNGAAVVHNDFTLEGAERIFIVSGPNQGGKTTFARTFGQLHFLGALGCPVPGSKARLFLSDKLFTHFESEENIRDLRGKLQDDLVRIHDILSRSTSNSIIILNEIFTSTTLKDASFLSREILERIIQLDLLCVYVTFIDELASLSEKTVSMVSTVTPENPAIRTFKIIRRPADGLAYALSIAEKYRLTYGHVKERIKP